MGVAAALIFKLQLEQSFQSTGLQKISLSKGASTSDSCVADSPQHQSAAAVHATQPSPTTLNSPAAEMLEISGLWRLKVWKHSDLLMCTKFGHPIAVDLHQ